MDNTINMLFVLLQSEQERKLFAFFFPSAPAFVLKVHEDKAY